MIKKSLVSFWFKIFNDPPEDFLGRIIVVFVPRHYLKKIKLNFFNYNFRHGKLINIIRKGIVARYYEMPDKQLKIEREKLWNGDAGRNWHEMRWKLYQDAKAYKSEFLQPRIHLVKQLKGFLAKNHSYHTLCEFGTGNGVFIDLLSHELNGSSIKRYLGIDLNSEQMAINNERFKKNKRLTFCRFHIDRWVQKYLTHGTILVSVGTLECFTQAELESFFKKIADKNFRTTIGLNETVNFDLSKELNSRPRGNTWYSHNYPYLLKKAGFKIIFSNLSPSNTKGAGSVSLLAEST